MIFMPTNSSGFWAVETAREGHLTWIELKFTCDKLKLNLNVTQNKAICINSLRVLSVILENEIVQITNPSKLETEGLESV